MNTDCVGTVDKIIRKVPGKCAKEGMIYLCELAHDLQVPGVFVDLGTYQGRSAMVLAGGSLGNHLGRRIVSIDNYTEGPNAKDPSEGEPPQFWQVRRRFKCRGRVHLVWGNTTDVPMVCQREPVALVFVDADHNRSGVLADIQTWKPLVVPGGLMVFDDYGNDRWPDVKPLVDEMMADWERLDVRGTVAAFRRKD